MSKTEVPTPPDLASPGFDSTVRTKAKHLRSRLVQQTLEDINSYNRACESEYENYKREYQAGHHGQPPPAVVPVEVTRQWRDTIKNGYYDWVVPAFEAYLEPDLRILDKEIDRVDTVAGSFKGIQDGKNVRFADRNLARINDIRSDMNRWEGGLRDNFIDNFVTPLQETSINVGSVVECAGDQLKLAKVVYVRQRKEVLTLLDKSINAVDHLKHTCSGHDAVTWATLIGLSIGTIALAVPSAGTSVVVAGSLVSITSTLAQGLIPDEDENKNNLGASTAQQVACNVSDALTRLDNKTKSEEGRLRTSMLDLSHGVSKVRSARSGPLSVPEPAIDNASATEVSKGLRPAD